MIDTRDELLRFLVSAGYVNTRPTRVGKKDRQEWREKHAEWAVEKDLHRFGELFYSMVPGEPGREVEAWKLQLVIGRSRLTFLSCICLLRSLNCVKTQYCEYFASKYLHNFQ